MFDVLIVGGGPVGACAGALLARESSDSLRPCVSAYWNRSARSHRPLMPIGLSRRRHLARE